MPDAERKKKRYATCDAKRRRREERCTLPAGWGTDHPGTGRCKYHGGCSPIKHGLYSKVAGPQLRQAIEQVRASGVDKYDLSPEIELVRAKLLVAVESPKAIQPGFLEPVIDALGRIAKRAHEMEHGQKFVLDIHGIEFVIQQIIGIIEHHVKDSDTRAAIGRDLSRIRLSPDRGAIASRVR
jgi:hypothetical protein